MHTYPYVGNNMKKSIFILLFGLCACKSGLDSSPKMELESLKNCIESEQREILEMVVESFEMKIQKQYPKISKEKGYFEFITDWSNKKLNKDFFNDSLDLKVRSLNLWTESIRSDKDMELEKKLFNVDSMNPVRSKLNVEFSNCLSKTMDWRNGISNFLRVNSKYRISPRHARKYLYGTSEYDLKNFESRLAIVLGVYYQTMFNIKNTVANKAQT